jgi:hypothetical protein
VAEQKSKIQYFGKEATSQSSDILEVILDSSKQRISCHCQRIEMNKEKAQFDLQIGPFETQKTLARQAIRVLQGIDKVPPDPTERGLNEWVKTDGITCESLQRAILFQAPPLP